ncbi:unnamed protein product [Protopolystoma xenopodis]|uniref:Uncharacterized protein n=1 Tax=Protopolystoma xenopodis TaxID=117903 RepID=A0A448XJY8_9PLAT|nr:unnamed protein product [Protopolystoma xenopodis]
MCTVNSNFGPTDPATTFLVFAFGELSLSMMPFSDDNGQKLKKHSSESQGGALKTYSNKSIATAPRQSPYSI